MPRSLRIQMSARAVIARGLSFSPRRETYADADVALDEIRTLTNPIEPSVLRVTASGGSAAARARVEGDWLCDTDGAEPRRIERPSWGYTKESRAWSERRSWVEAWESCTDATWMMHALARGRVDRAWVVRAACACARTVLECVPPDERMPANAIDAAEGWLRGEVREGFVRVAANGLFAIPTDAPFAAAALSAAYAASCVYQEGYSLAWDAASCASYAADLRPGEDASVVTESNDPRRVRRLAELADLVRDTVPTRIVLRAALSW